MKLNEGVERKKSGKKSVEKLVSVSIDKVWLTGSR